MTDVVEIENQLGEVVVAALSWSPSAPLHAALQDHHRTRLEARWKDSLALFRRAHVGGRISALDPSGPARERFLTAPETSRRLQHGRLDDLRFFLEGTRAEWHREHPDEPAPVPLWTARGDAYLPADVAWSDRGGPSDDLVATNDRQPFLAPSVRGVPVDFASPYVRRAGGLDVVAEPPTRSEQVREDWERIRDAVAAIEATSPAATELLDAHTRTIVSRRAEDPATGLSSFSADEYVGRVGLVNVARGDVAEAVDAIVHESIHAFVYVLEEIAPLATDREAAERTTVASPWTGRELPVHSFFHACLVWFALSRYWERALETGPYEQRRARQLRSEARRGFGTDALRGAWARAAPLLDERWSFLPSLVSGATTARRREGAAVRHAGAAAVAPAPVESLPDGPVAFLERAGAAAVEHSGATLLTHLRGTAALLTEWGAAPATRLAGLFHSVYGTAALGRGLLPVAARATVRAVIGRDAERLAYLFGAVDEHALLDAARSADDPAPISLIDRHTGGTAQLTPDELMALVAVAVANWAEQAPRLMPVGEAVREAERRYSGLSDSLPEPALAHLGLVEAPA